MRTIKFRGKDRFGEIWHYGNLVVNEMFEHTHIWDASLGIVKYNVYTFKANGDYYAKRWSWYYNGQLYQMYEADKLVEAINRTIIK